MKKSAIVVVAAVITTLILTILVLGVCVLRQLSIKREKEESAKAKSYIEQMSQARESTAVEPIEEPIEETFEETLTATQPLETETDTQFMLMKGNLKITHNFDLSMPNGAVASVSMNSYAEEHNLTDGLLEGLSFENYGTYVVVYLRYNGVEDVYTYVIGVPEG